MTSTWNFAPRSQFVVISENQLPLLERFAEAKINLTGFFAMGKLFLFVVGSANPTTNPAADEAQVKHARKILKEICDSWQEYTVFEVNGQATSGVPGSYLKLIQAFAEKQIHLQATYNGEENSLYFDVTDSKREFRHGLKILNQFFKA
jgi:hypothetical protein